jgi:hypothetical protein
LAVAFSLTPTPPANDFVVERDLDKPQPSIPLTLLLCTSCGHLQLAEIVDPARLFGHYDYVSGTSRVFVAHFYDYAKDAVSRFGLGAASFVVEIGSNDGTLLRQFMDQGVRNVLGVDPAKDKRPQLPNGPGHGRPMGSKNVITKEWVNKHLRWRVEFDPVAALFERHGKGPGAVWTVRDLAALSEQERMCLESFDIVKGNVDQSDDALETVIKPRWYAKDRALELYARSLGMLKDSMTVTVSDETLARLDEWKAANRARQLADTDDSDSK